MDVVGAGGGDLKLTKSDVDVDEFVGGDDTGENSPGGDKESMLSIPLSLAKSATSSLLLPGNILLDMGEGGGGETNCGNTGGGGIGKVLQVLLTCITEALERTGAVSMT